LRRVLGRLERGDFNEPPEYPSRTHSFVVQPLVRVGRAEDARAHYRRALSGCTGNRVFLREIARLLVFATGDGQLEDVARLVDNHLVWALTSYDHWSAMLWFVAAARALQPLSGRQLRPRSVDEPRFGAGATIAAERLAAELWDEATRLAAEMDARNGNATWSTLAAEIRDGAPPDRLFLRY
jgi:hypothetical protein